MNERGFPAITAAHSLARLLVSFYLRPDLRFRSFLLLFAVWPLSSYLSVCGRASRAVAIWTPTLDGKWSLLLRVAPIPVTKRLGLSL